MLTAPAQQACAVHSVWALCRAWVLPTMPDSRDPSGPMSALWAAGAAASASSAASQPQPQLRAGVGTVGLRARQSDFLWFQLVNFLTWLSREYPVASYFLTFHVIVIFFYGVLCLRLLAKATVHGMNTLAEIGVMTGYVLFDELDNVFCVWWRDQGVAGWAFHLTQRSSSLPALLTSSSPPSLVSIKDIVQAVAAEAAFAAVNSGVADPEKFVTSAVQGALLAFRASGLHLQPGASATSSEPSAVASDGVRAKPPSTLLLGLMVIFCCTKMGKFIGF